MLKTKWRALIFAGQAVTFCCLLWPWDDPFEQYLQRKDSVRFGSGDAKEINSATHIIDPWSRYSRNVHIPGDGARMSDVVQRYHDVSKLPNAPRPIQSEYDSATNIQAANSGGGGGK